MNEIMNEIMNTRMFQWKEGIASGLAKHMDIILLNENCFIFNKNIQQSKTIFINTRDHEKLILLFINNILPTLTQPINLIIAGSDYTFPNNTDKRMTNTLSSLQLQQFKELGNHQFINKIFVENLDENIPNTIPIPLGINPLECPVSFEYFMNFENINDNKPLKITNFNRRRNGLNQWEEREKVFELCKKDWNHLFIYTNITENHEIEFHKQYLTEMGKYSFTLCVHGGGLDVNPKLWEALLIGVIPIIKENKPYTNIYTKLNLPVVIIDDWNSNSITIDNLIIWHKKYYSYFTDIEKRKQTLYYLSLNYWSNCVKL